MKYYVIKDKTMDGYLSRKLCRINKKGKFEVYDWKDLHSSGSWLSSEKYKDIFDTKNDAYEIWEAGKEEIDEIIYEVDDAAYEDAHTHVGPEIVDDKGRKHSVFIYQDYRSLDGYDADDGFNYNEIWDREDYDYYFDLENSFLIKIEKETNRIFIFKKNENKEWIEFTKIENFNKVIEFINRCEL